MSGYENVVIRETYMETKQLLADEFSDYREMYQTLKGHYIEGVLSAFRQASSDVE